MFTAVAARAMSAKSREREIKIDNMMKTVEYVVSQKCNEGKYIARVDLFCNDYSIFEYVQEQLISLGFKCEICFDRHTDAPTALIIEWMEGSLS